MTMADHGEDEPRRKRPIAKPFRFGYLVHDVSRTRRTLLDTFMRPAGVTRSQWTVLSALSRAHGKGMTQVDLARLLDVGKVTIGGLVDRLEHTGYVERRPDPQDRRAKLVYVTEKGFEIIKLMIRVSNKINRKILNGISDEDLQVVERVLMQVKANIKVETLRNSES